MSTQSKSWITETPDYYRIKEIVENITYRNWKFEVGYTEWSPEDPSIWENKVEVGAVVSFPDVHNSNDEVFFEVLRYFDLSAPKEKILDELWNAIAELEEHERKEHFRYKKQCVYNPHP